MKRTFPIRTLALSLTTLALAGAAGCGGDDDSGDEAATGTEAVERPATGTTSPAAGATGPASAGDERPAAPDDAVSDRPGGPGTDQDDGGSGQPQGSVGGSGGISVPQPEPTRP